MNKKTSVVQGCVISNKMMKSVVVVTERLFKHKMYRKFIQRRTKLHVHDEKNICSIGDIVQIRECRPISKTKSWILVKIVKKSLL